MREFRSDGFKCWEGCATDGNVIAAETRGINLMGQEMPNPNDVLVHW